MNHNISHLIKQKSYEKIEYVLRRHPITFVPQLILFVVTLSMPIILYLMIKSIFPDIFANQVIYASSVIACSVYYLSILLFIFTHFIDFYLDVWIITNDRIIDIEQFGLFSRTISEMDLFRIQDVTTEVKGFFSTIFHYGNVSVATASSTTSIVFRDVPNPNKIREELLRLAHDDYKYHRGTPET